MLSIAGRSIERRTLITLGIAFLLGVALTFAGLTLANAQGEGDVAVVNGQALSKEEFYARLEDEMGQEVLGQIITEMVIAQAEKGRNLSIDDALIQAEIDAIRESYPSEAAFLSDLRAYGITIERLAYEIRLNMILTELSREGITVSDEEITEFFEENKANLGQPEQLRVRHILVNTEAQAKEIHKELKEGADFAQLAESRSTDTASAINGGEIGLIHRDSPIVPSFLDAAFKLDAGEFSEPVESPFGWHIIKVDERIAAKEASLDESRDQIREALMEQKARPFSEVIDELLTSAEITVLWDRYQSLLDWRNAE